MRARDLVMLDISALEKVSPPWAERKRVIMHYVSQMSVDNESIAYKFASSREESIILHLIYIFSILTVILKHVSVWCNDSTEPREWTEYVERPESIRHRTQYLYNLRLMSI